MEMQEKYSLVGIVDFLNEKYKTKQTGEPFNVQDVQGYIQRGKFPDYLGGTQIEEVDVQIRGGNKAYYLLPKKEKR